MNVEVESFLKSVTVLFILEVPWTGTGERALKIGVIIFIINSAALSLHQTLDQRFINGLEFLHVHNLT